MSNGLGRGLGSLIPQNNNTVKSTPPQLNKVEPAQSQSKNSVIEIDINNIKVNPMQPRTKFTDYKLDELVDSIKEHGVIQPILVTKKSDYYELIAGERRLRASKGAGLKKVPAILMKLDDKKKLEIAIIENLQREQLTPIDLAQAYQRLIDEFDLTQEEVAKKMGKSRSSVSNTLRMLKLPDEIKLALIDGKIHEGHAKYILGLDTEVKQMGLFRKILANNLSVSDTNKESKRMGGTKEARVKINYADKDKEFKLREYFGTKVEIKRKGKGGQVVIDFYSEDELKNILDKTE